MAKDEYCYHCSLPDLRNDIDPATSRADNKPNDLIKFAEMCFNLSKNPETIWQPFQMGPGLVGSTLLGGKETAHSGKNIYILPFTIASLLLCSI